MDHGEPPDVAQLRAELATVRRELMRSEELRRESRDRETMLAAELQHRVRNMMAIIRSVFARTAETAESLEDAADHFRGRLDTIARHHLQLTRDTSATADLETLIRDELLVFGFADGKQIVIKGPEVKLADKTVEMLGLALHELATNSIKFGALATETGQLSICWTKRAAADGERVSIEWVESGVAVVASAPMRIGFGREYIEQALPYQFAARTSFALRPGGVACEISFSPGAGKLRP